ncbi:hypothetical protein OAE19_10025, partial [Porticoccaceae bacterium]|nr:hypothetical protein [Porticoccaceae bacterium]
NVSVLIEPIAQGLNAAVEAGTRWSVANAYQTQLVLAPDIAELKANELQPLFDRANSSPEPLVIIAVANDGGTNALLTRPPNAIPFQYGSQSARRMYRDSQQRGLASERCYLPHLALDIDTPKDLSCWKILADKQGQTDRQEERHRHRKFNSPSLKASGLHGMSV